jgi:septal ring factor EnvC (AmiA/AmiB activator)
MFETLSNKDIILLATLFLVGLQWLYRIWEKRDNKAIIDSFSTSFKEALESFQPTVERSKRTFGIVQDLKKVHEVRDEDGRPMWYMPKEIIETQRELVKLTHTVAMTQSYMAESQKQIADLLSELNTKVEMHKTKCESQFNQIVETVKAKE